MYAGGSLFASTISSNGIAVFYPFPQTTNTVTPSFYLTGVNVTNARLPITYAIYAIRAGTKFIVSDMVARRVVIFNTVPTQDVPYDVVLGQPTFNDLAAQPISNSTMNQVYSLVYVNGKLVASDYAWNRLQVWNNVPVTNNTASDYVIGQTDVVSSTSGCSAT